MLNTFLSTLNATDVARKNRYRISISGPGPQAAGGFEVYSAMRCESIEFPGQNMMSSADTLRFGPQREMINGVTYGPVTATFICSPDMREKRFFERWQEQTIDLTTWEPKYYSDYIGGMKIFQYDRDNRATYVVEMFEVYPKTVMTQDMAYSSNDAYQTIGVELDYHHWEFADETGPSRLRQAGRMNLARRRSREGSKEVGDSKGSDQDKGTVQRQKPRTKQHGFWADNYERTWGENIHSRSR